MGFQIVNLRRIRTPPRHDRSPRSIAHRLLTVGAKESRATLCQSIEMRRDRDLVSITPESGTQVIDGDEQHVGRRPPVRGRTFGRPGKVGCLDDDEAGDGETEQHLQTMGIPEIARRNQPRRCASSAATSAPPLPGDLQSAEVLALTELDASADTPLFARGDLRFAVELIGEHFDQLQPQ